MSGFSKTAVLGAVVALIALTGCCLPSYRCGTCGSCGRKCDVDKFAYPMPAHYMGCPRMMHGDMACPCPTCCKMREQMATCPCAACAMMRERARMQHEGARGGTAGEAPTMKPTDDGVEQPRTEPTAPVTPDEAPRDMTPMTPPTTVPMPVY